MPRRRLSPILTGLVLVSLLANLAPASPSGAADMGQYSAYGRFAIYVSVTDNPLGPFEAVSSSPAASRPFVGDFDGDGHDDIFW